MRERIEQALRTVKVYDSESASEWRGLRDWEIGPMVDVLVPALSTAWVDMCAEMDAPCWCGHHGVAALTPVPSPAEQLIADILASYPDELDKASCDRCEQCGQMVMCSFHSVISMLQRHVAPPVAAETPSSVRFDVTLQNGDTGEITKPGAGQTATPPQGWQPIAIELRQAVSHAESLGWSGRGFPALRTAVMAVCKRLDALTAVPPADAPAEKGRT